jgi:GxxExxY protein
MGSERRGAELTRSIIGGFYEVYNDLGFGLLESVYSLALVYELRARGHRVMREVWTDVLYKGIPIARQRLHMVIDNAVIIEIKATEQLPAFARRQLLNYLTVTKFELGLMLHFGPEAKVHRLINTRRSSKICDNLGSICENLRLNTRPSNSVL